MAGVRVAVREPILGFVPGKNIYHNENADMSATGRVMAVSQRRNCTWIFDKTYPGGRTFRMADAFILETENPPDEGGFVTLEIRQKVGGGPIEKIRRPWTRTTRFTSSMSNNVDYVFHSLVFHLPRGVERHSYALLALDAERLLPPAAACGLEVDTGNPIHVTRGAEEPASLVFSNKAGRAIAFACDVTMSGPCGRDFSFPLSFSLKPGGVFRHPVGNVPLMGVWSVCAHVKAEGSAAKAWTSFARIPRHEATPQLPPGMFRIGINYHMRRYSPIDRKITLDALVASGAKIVRGVGATFATVCGKEGEYDWRSTDEALATLWERGIATDVGIWDTPRWAADERHRTNSNWLVWIRSFPRDGLYAEFAERLAARYGTKIAYYELGNEWDLESADRLTIDDGIAAQKMAYSAIKKSCPDAVVIPNGWACFGSDDAKVRQKGFHERLMTEAKGFYDFHPVHMHGPFPAFRREALRFLAMRKKLSIDVPWYANETAESTMFGNDEQVADCVWQKVLWSWAHGSRDFVWYNLRATGYDAGDWEQGYGLLTADFHPRASYAAFAALTSVFHGLAYERTLADDHDRALFVFSGRRGERPVKIVAGWDRAESTELDAETDAIGALSVDLYGNTSQMATAGGHVRWRLGKRPGCVVLDGARTVKIAKPDPRKPRTRPRVTLPATPWQSRKPDVVLDDVRQVVDLYKADPSRTYRLWHGPADLSARAWLTLADEALAVHVEVTDDVHVRPSGPNLGDSLKIALGDPAMPKSVFLWEGCGCYGLSVKREGSRTTYDAAIPLAAFGTDRCDAEKGTYAEVFVIESDGEGNDGWMSAEFR